MEPVGIVINKDHLQVVAALDDMMWCIRKEKFKWSWHASQLTFPDGKCNKSAPFSFYHLITACILFLL